MIAKFSSILCMLVLGLTLVSVPAQSADVKITPVQVAEKIYMLAGQGGNIGGEGGGASD